MKRTIIIAAFCLLSTTALAATSTVALSKTGYTQTQYPI
ncbi:MAG: lipase, partial [Vibrio anguillarum]